MPEFLQDAMFDPIALADYFGKRARIVEGRIAVRDPANSQLLCHVPAMGADVAAVAVEHACAYTPPDDPTLCAALLNTAELLERHKNPIARIITLENGKPLIESLTEVEYAASFFTFYAHLRKPDYGVPENPRSLSWRIRHIPAGVATLITPWNFPLAQVSKKCSAALRAGCAFVLKPSEVTPLSAIALHRILIAAGFHADAVQLVIGEPDTIGKVITQHPSVRVVSFTGSTATGLKLASITAPLGKRLTLEMGGNAPFMVFKDADLHQAARAAAFAKFRCAGQTCICPNRILVHASVAEAFAEALVHEARAIPVGHGLDPNTRMGPLIRRNAWDKVKSHMDDAVARGAHILTGADQKRPETDLQAFFKPAVLYNVSPDSLLWKEETFGPLAAVTPFETPEQALQLANKNPAGLAAYLFTRDEQIIASLTPKLRYGHLALNTASTPTPHAPFGGMGSSGYGREGGTEGLLEFLDCQTVVRPG